MDSTTEYYFDLETTGFDPLSDKIITIQFQELDRNTGEPKGDLTILKEWESSEKEILTDFLPNLTKFAWDFIMIGNNLLFEFSFLTYRAKKYGLHDFDIRHWGNRVWLDLKHVLVMINSRADNPFRGYPTLFRKTGNISGRDIPELYNNEHWPVIVKYIQDEAEDFITSFKTLKREMPSLLEKL